MYPVADRYLDIAPYNSFSFNCSAMITVPGISVNLHRVFSWQRTIEGSSSNISAEFFTGSQVQVEVVYFPSMPLKQESTLTPAQ